MNSYIGVSIPSFYTISLSPYTPYPILTNPDYIRYIEPGCVQLAFKYKSVRQGGRVAGGSDI
jgi:hypothetical protein